MVGSGRRGSALVVFASTLAFAVHCGGQTGGSGTEETGDHPNGTTGGSGGSSTSPRSGGATASGGSRIASGGAVSSGGSSSTPVLVPCNDVTGRTDCCGPDVRGGDPCDPNEATTCSPICPVGSFYSNFVCGPDHRWGGGHGLFPCQGVTGPAACRGAGGECLYGEESSDCIASALNLDCNEGHDGGTGVCCLQRAPHCEDAGTDSIWTKDYDTTCATDSDCTVVGEGNACSEICALVCPMAAINKKEAARYGEALDALLAGADPFCGCPVSTGPRCSNGHCSPNAGP